MKIRIVRKTDQWNNEDFAAGSRIFTISHVTEGKEQVPYDIHFSDGEGRCWRPSNGMLELLVHFWGNDSTAWPGRRIELFQDAAVRIGSDVVGGIRVRAMSHIDKPMSKPITVSRGKKKPYTVQPLLERDWQSDIASAATLDALQQLWLQATAAGVTKQPEIVAAKDARKVELQGVEA